MGRILVVLTILLAGPVVRAGAKVSVLFPSGRLGTDGIGIDGFQRPVVEPSGRVAFLGSSSAVLYIENGTASVLARPGDPLPPPLTGTFNRIASVALSPGGIIVFGATLNSTAGTGVFRRDAGALVAIVIGEGSGSDLAVADDGAVAYRSGRGIQVVPAGGTPAVVVDTDSVVPDGGAFQRFRQIAVGAGPTVVFGARVRRRGVDGLFRWTPSGGVERLASENDSDTRSRFALGSTGLVAFIQRTTRTVSLFDPANGTTTVIAQPGLPVGDGVLEQVEVGYVHVDDMGRVFFVGRIGGVRRLIQVADGVATTLGGDLGTTTLGQGRSDDGTVIGVTGDQLVFVSADGASTPAASTAAVDRGFTVPEVAIERTGATLARLSRNAVYRLDGDQARRIAWVGADVPDVGRLAYLWGWALDAESVVVLADGPDDRRVLLGDTGSGLRKLVGRGDPVPGGTLVLEDGFPPAVRDGTVAFDSNVDGGPRAIFTVDARGGPVRRVAYAGALVGKRRTLKDVYRPQWLGNGIVFVSATEETFDLLVRRPGGRIASIARTNGRAPGGGHFYQVSEVLVGERRILFEASLREKKELLRTYLKAGGRVRPFALPESGFPVGFLGDRVLYLREDGNLVAVGRAGTETLAVFGAPVPTGGTIAGIIDFSTAGRRAVIAVNLDQAPVASVLLEVVERR